MNFKESIAECSKLFRSFPELGAFVVDLPSLKQWHMLDIADHIPADQCLMALSTKVKDVTEAAQVGGA